MSVMNLHIDSKDLKETPLISGEKIQEKCDVYVGTADDFDYNPYFKNQKC